VTRRRNKSVFDAFSSEKAESSFSEEKEAKRLLFLVPTRDARARLQILAALAGCLALGLAAVQFAQLVRLRAVNAAIAAFAENRDAALPRDANPILRAARGLMLLKQNRVDDAQAELDSIDPDRGGPARATLQYALANAHLRRALELFNSEPMRKVAPLIGLAQSEYRQVLRRDPDNWDARTNFDIASGLTHDPDVAAYLKGDDMARERALVPDAPGAPNGLP
jgi:mxaK protein